MNPMTRTSSYKEAQESQRFAQQRAASQSAQDSEISHRSSPNKRDDDELRASCVGSTNFGAPPRRR